MKIRILRLRLPGWRTAAALSAAAAIVVGATALGAPNQSSSASAAASPVAYAASTGSRPAQGGCKEYPVGKTGFEFGVCVNDRHTGTTAYPDIYVNHVGPHSGPCSISIELWDDKNRSYGTPAQAPCTPGPHPGNPYGPVRSALTLHTFARLKANGTTYYFGGGQGDSPPISLAPGAGSDVFYDWDWIVVKRLGSAGLSVKSTPAKALAELHRCYNCSFPVPGAPAAFPTNGQALALHGLPFPPNWLAGPSLFFTQPDGYMVVARDGHQDGAAAEVTFHFYTDRSGYLHLQTRAIGVNPPNWWSPAPVNWIAARVLWTTFSQNLGTNLVAHGEGTIG